MTTTLIETSEYDIRAEFLWFGVILHSDVHVPWTKGVLKRFRQDLQKTICGLGLPAYAFQTPTHDPKQRKFIRMVGGVYDHSRLTGDGEWAEMYRFPPLDLIQRNQYGKSFQKQDDHHETTL